ncbi:hypothetical protein GCM10010260_82340 [Streptomyces filipinensis]|uniref:Transposase n=1 Tax=Streptomyces filipinensis TaxID=66887 RepID=A0A918IMR7_9ACTN|nr:hypothetical protein GCM10010260_82340 [Streptomyces filipinensis]
MSSNQYTGTAGRIENAQVAVSLVYAGRRGHAAGDEVHGGNPRLRAALGERGTGYVLALVCSHEVTTGAGRFRADTLARKVPKKAWQKLSAGVGAKGHRFYDWAVIDLTDLRPGSQQLLIRRHRSTGELAYHRCYSPAAAVPLTTLVRVAGSRWRVEELFQSGKGLAALDEHQVRRYPSWSRWVTWPCSRTPSSPSSARTNTTAIPHQTPSYRSPATRSNGCSSRSSSGPPLTRSTGSACPTGDAATRPDPRPATTGGKPLEREDHDLRLEY